jgi:hypothetical protein
MQLDAVTGAFLSAMHHSLPPNTRRAHRYDLGLLTRTFPHLDAADLTVEHLRALRNYVSLMNDAHIKG